MFNSDCGGSNSSTISAVDKVLPFESYFGGMVGEVNGEFYTKKDIIKRLQRHARSLISIKLSQPTTCISQALKDFRRERVLFNDVPFIPDKTDSHRNIAFAMTLEKFLSRMRTSFAGCDKSCTADSKDALTSLNNSLALNLDENVDAGSGSGARTNLTSAESEDLLNLDQMTSHNIILQRACRTSAGADSFFMVQGLFATVQGTFVTQRTNIVGFVPFVNGEPPVQVEVFVQPTKVSARFRNADASTEDLEAAKNASGNITSNSENQNLHGKAQQKHADDGMDLVARIRVCNSFAVYDEDIIDLIAGEPETDPPPWLELETIINDEMNFRTGEQRRVLEVQVYCPENGEYYPPLETKKK